MCIRDSRNRWVAFPFRPGDLLRSLPPAFAVAAGRDIVTKPLRRPVADTYAEVVRVGLGPSALADFHGPMAEKLWGLPADQLSGELARRRIPVRSPGSLVRKVVRTSRPEGRIFLSPRRGFGQLIDALVDRCVAEGVELSTGTFVESLAPAADGPTVACLLYTSPSPRDATLSRMPSSA